METPTPTPETDREAYDCTDSNDELSQQRDMCKWGSHVSSDFARKLERERDEARKDADSLWASLAEYSEPVRTSKDGGSHWCLIRNNNGASAMVERIKSALSAHEALTKNQPTTKP